ncbi:MAG: SWIM zinc finger family protein, partial [Myxococcota bacterium]
MGGAWGRYISVAARKAKADRIKAKLRKSGKLVYPLEISGGKIANTFWGKAWCDHLKKFSDYENRLPRGRSYVRHGQVCHLEILPGQVKALVSGSDLYEVRVLIKELLPIKWKHIQEKCAGEINSIIELLQGNISDLVMDIVTDKSQGLFPHSSEIQFGCSCPDFAYMCKHVAAVLYGVGSRLDEKPELLFNLRGVDPKELISGKMPKFSESHEDQLETDELENIFGIELDEEVEELEEVQEEVQEEGQEEAQEEEVQKKETSSKASSTASAAVSPEAKASNRKPRRIIASVSRNIRNHGGVNPHFTLAKDENVVNNVETQEITRERVEEEISNYSEEIPESPEETDLELAEEPELVDEPTEEF